MGLGTRLKHAWNAFNGGDPHRYYLQNLGFSSSVKPDTKPLSFGNDRTIISSIYSRMAIDVAALKFRHVRIDSEGNYVDEIQSTLNYCLKDRANKDQTARAFIQDCAYSLFDEGCIAIVPTTANKSPIISDSYNIGSLRVGKILEWWPDMVRVQVYNEDKGERKELILPKKMVAIVQNPLYSVMNEPNSILKRLLSALRQMDAVDEQLSSGKLDMIIQLPYVVKNRTQADEAEKRRKNLEVQLASSKIGIGYIDGTEKIVQLNRPLENNILSKTEYLTSMLFGQLGISENVFKGTGTEEEQLYYFNSAIEPVAAAIADGMRTIFLTKTARSQGQSIMFFRDNFKLVSVTNLAESADKFIRNEILSANEFRSILGRKPSSNPKSDELRNPNMPQEDQPAEPQMEEQMAVPGDLGGGLTEQDLGF